VANTQLNPRKALYQANGLHLMNRVHSKKPLNCPGPGHYQPSLRPNRKKFHIIYKLLHVGQTSSEKSAIDAILGGLLMYGIEAKKGKNEKIFWYSIQKKSRPGLDGPHASGWYGRVIIESAHEQDLPPRVK